MKRLLLIILIILIMVGLAGCVNKTLSGKYIEESNGTVMEFRDNYVTVVGFTATYKIKDDIITITKNKNSISGVYDSKNDIITIEGETYKKANP